MTSSLKVSTQGPRSLFGPGDPDTDGRFLSKSQSRALADRIFAMTKGGGKTNLYIDSRWIGNLRWARNDIVTGGDTQQTNINLSRNIRGAGGNADTNAMTDQALRDCMARAEALILLRDEDPDDYPDPMPETHPHGNPKIWFEKTVSIDEPSFAAIADRAIAPAEAAHMFAAGYIEVNADSHSVLNNQGLFRYYPYTTAQCSITVRDPKGVGSGWAGVDWNDWDRINPEKLAQIALDKCLRSRNPVAVEPGRYTAILEPQAVCDLVSSIADTLDREFAENGMGPFADPKRPGYSKIGQMVIDPRLTFSADPMDPDCGFVPFDWGGEPYTHVNWIDKGVLRELSYSRGYGLRQLSKDFALPNSGSFRLSGGTSTIEEMIANTTRGVLVTRFNNVQVLDINSLLATGNTRDGLWFIEHGKITKTIKNFRFTESPMFILNNIEMMGVPQRVFHPGAPAIVPPLMVRDFSFTGLIDAI